MRIASRARANPWSSSTEAPAIRTWEQQLPAIGASYRAIAYSRRYARPNEDIAPDADDRLLPHVEALRVTDRVQELPANAERR